METEHAISVVKTNSFTAPRISKTNLPATAKEINGETINTKNHVECASSRKENRNSNSRSTVSRHVDKHKHFDKSLILNNDDYVNEEDFYQNLIKLKEEHKKSLKLLQTRYYTELKNQNNFQWDGFKDGVALNQQNKPKQFIEDDFNNNFDTIRCVGDDRVYGKPPKSPACKDTVRDMSHSAMSSDNSGENGGSSDDDQPEGDDTTTPRSPEEFSSSLFPKRSAAIDMVEELWKDFSVRDYSARNNETLEEQGSLTKVEAATKEWSPAVTIPKPFTMTLRENQKVKQKSRSMKMIEEELLVKKSLEEAELKKKFRAQPVPATTFLPLYDELMEKNQRRGEHVRELNKAILKATEKPFSFTEREEQKKRQKEAGKKRSVEEKGKSKRGPFKARPAPKNMDNLTIADILTEQDEYRKIRTKLRAAELMAQSRLPPRMEARAHISEAAKARQKSRRKDVTAKKAETFRPNINPDIPDFEALHWEFEKELRRKKKERQPTVIEPFNLHTAQIPQEKRSLRRIRSMENLSKSTESPLTVRKARPSSARLSSSHDTLPFGTTESVRLRDNAVRKSLETRKKQEKEATRGRKERRKREKELRSKVSVRAMANDNSWQLRKQQDEKLKGYRASDRGRQEDYERELAEMQQRVAQRPLLLEQQSRENAKRKAEQKYKRILRDAGVDETLVSKLVKKGEGIIDSDHDDPADSYDDDDDINDDVREMTIEHVNENENDSYESDASYETESVDDSV